jgi:hypothetical protein
VAVWRYVRSAPLTYGWLLVLLFTTMVAHSISPARLHHLLVHDSTNLHHLGRDPLYVLTSSLFWIDGKYWLPYLVLFTVFMAPAERWLGKPRWLAVGLITHGCATYLSEGVLYLEIEHHLAPERLINVRDIGVSYFLVGIVGVLSYRIARPWRWGYIAVALLIFVAALVAVPHFTEIGHLCALLVGLACYPLTLGRTAPEWDPGRLPMMRRLRTRGADRPRSGAAAPVHRAGTQRTARQ